MIVGFVDITGQGHLTSQLCFVAGLFSQFSEKKHLIISCRPTKAEHYLGIQVEEAAKKRNDLFRLVVNGQLTNQLIKDFSIPVSKGLDYLDASFILEKEQEYQHVLYEYLLEKANEGYYYVFVDLGKDIELSRNMDKTILCMPQSVIAIKQATRQKNFTCEKSNLPLILFGGYFPHSKWTARRLTREIKLYATLGVEFSYELFDAFQEGNLQSVLQRKYLKWEKEYKILSKYFNGGEERRK